MLRQRDGQSLADELLHREETLLTNLAEMVEAEERRMNERKEAAKARQQVEAKKEGGEAQKKEKASS